MGPHVGQGEAEGATRKWGGRHIGHRARQVGATTVLEDGDIQMRGPTVEPNARSVSAVALDPNGCERALTGGNDMQAKLWDVESGRVIQASAAPRGTLLSLPPVRLHPLQTWSWIPMIARVLMDTHSPEGVR